MVFVCIILAGLCYNVGAAGNNNCPTWTMSARKSDDGNQECVCGSSLGQLVRCSPDTLNVSLLVGNCMTFSNKTEESFVLECPFMTDDHANDYTPLPRDPSLLNHFMCSPYNRKGLVCSECTQGHSPSAFTGDLDCFKCSGLYHGWLLYLALELTLITIFFSILTVFHIRLTTSGANCLLFVVQMIASTLGNNSHAGIFPFGKVSQIFKKILLTLYGIWNLDFLRQVIPPFCVSETINGIHSMALYYLSVVYLFMLTMGVYFILQMHYRGFKPTMWLWRHVFSRLIRAKQKWTLRTSLIDSLASFILLSYTKVMLISFNLIYPASMFDEKGSIVKKTLFFQGNWEYFGSKHLPFAILAIVILLAQVLLPPLLFIVYPCFKRRGHNLKCRRLDIGLHAFVELFEGCFKDGTNKTRDYRFFSIFYFVLRFLMFVTHIIGFGGRPRISFLFPGLLFLIAASIMFYLQPYKKNIYNLIDGLILITSGISLVLYTVIILTPQTMTGILLQKFFQITLFLPVFAVLLYVVYLCLKVCRAKWNAKHPSRLSDEDEEIDYLVNRDRLLHSEDSLEKM